VQKYDVYKANIDLKTVTQCHRKARLAPKVSNITRRAEQLRGLPVLHLDFTDPASGPCLARYGHDDEIGAFAVVAVA